MAKIAKTGISQARTANEPLEKAQNAQRKRFLRLAGKVSGPRDLSQRKSFFRA